jgi:virginiamycin B lyase
LSSVAGASPAPPIEGASSQNLPERTDGTSVAVSPDGTAWFGAFSESGPVLVHLQAKHLTVEKLAKKGRWATTTALRFDPQGNLWFAEVEGGRASIVRRRPSGARHVTRLPRGGWITGLATGTEGDAWYTRGSRRSAAIGRVTANGLGVQTPLARGSLPSSVAVGSDGAAWFTELRANKIGRITPGGKPQLFALEPGIHPRQIVAGPDGALWFSEDGKSLGHGKLEDRIGRITTSGQVSQFQVPFGRSTQALAPDPSGVIWFTTDEGEFASISTAGVVGGRGCFREGCGIGIEDISLGPDGALWFAAHHESCEGCGGSASLMNENLGTPIGSFPIASLAPPAPAALALSAASASTAPPFPSAEANGEAVSAAKAYRRYPVYWAGEEVAGLPLTDFAGTGGSIKKSGWTSFYGSCELSGTDHPSCALPLQIQVSSTCRRWASALDRNKKLFGFRGAQAYWFPGLPLEGGGVAEVGPLEIFTGRVTVVVFAETKKLSFAAARALRTVRQAQPAPLPPPAPGSLSGKLPCQTKPG